MFPTVSYQKFTHNKYQVVLNAMSLLIDQTYISSVAFANIPCTLVLVDDLHKN